MMRALDRLMTWVQLMFTAADQFIGTWLRGWFFVWFDAEQPNPDETISSWIGRNALLNERWALRAQSVVDFIFGAGHCKRAIGK